MKFLYLTNILLSENPLLFFGLSFLIGIGLIFALFSILATLSLWKKPRARKTSLIVLLFSTLLMVCFPSIFIATQYIRYYSLDHKSYNLAELSDYEYRILGYEDFIDLPQSKLVAEHSRFKFYSTPERAFNDNEIAVLKSVIDRVPENLIAQLPTEVKVVSYPPFNDEEGSALVNTIFISDNTFSSQFSYVDVSLIFTHEMTHLAQFNSVSTDKIKQTLANFSSLDLVRDSELIQDYIDGTGWELTDDGTDYVIDTKIESHRISEYGKFGGPAEDMADAVAYFLTGRHKELSQDRVDWVRKFLDIESNLSLYQFPYPDSNYTWANSIPALPAHYYDYVFTPSYNPSTNTTKFVDNIEKNKTVSGKKYQVAMHANLQLAKSDSKLADIMKTWEQDMRKLGWSVYKKSPISRDSSKVSKAFMVFQGPKETMLIKFEDRRSFVLKSDRDQAEGFIASNRAWGIDSSYWESALKDISKKESEIRKQGVFLALEWGLDL